MDDLISRAAALYAIDCERKLLIERNQLGAEHIVVHHARRQIEELPAVDVAPMVHGHWTERHVDYASDCAIDEVQTAKCSVCGLYHTTPYLYSFTGYNFCPNCGAKMDGERRDDDGKIS